MEIRYRLSAISFDDPSSYVHAFEGDIYAIAEGSMEANKVGKISGYLIDVASATDDGVRLFDVFDSVNDTVYRYYDVLFDQDGE